MRRVFSMVWAVLALGCQPPAYDRSPPVGRFYYPSGVVHVDTPHVPEGLLFVASTNFDKRYEAGSLLGINLSKVGLPPFGVPPREGLSQVVDLQTTKAGAVEIATFAGELAALDLGNGKFRLFVLSRSEGMKYQAVDVLGPADRTGDPTLTCFTPAGTDDRDCSTQAPSLASEAVEQSETGLPRAPFPYSVAVRARACASTSDCEAGECVGGFCSRDEPGRGRERLGDVFITHMRAADSPFRSQRDLHTYLIHLPSNAVQASPSDYLEIGASPGASAAVGRKWVYVSGRVGDTLPVLMRLVNPQGVVVDASVESSFRMSDSRGVALSHDERRVFLAGRQPDMLLVLSVSDPQSPLPLLQVMRAVALPGSPNQVRTIPRRGRGDLVVITCTAAGVVALYDDDVGDVVAQVPGVGLQPFDVAADLRDPGARLYVTNFGDGRVAVIDVTDLGRPQTARLVAHLGESQLCLTRGANQAGCSSGGTP